MNSKATRCWCFSLPPLGKRYFSLLPENTLSIQAFCPSSQPEKDGSSRTPPHRFPLTGTSPEEEPARRPTRKQKPASEAEALCTVPSPPLRVLLRPWASSTPPSTFGKTHVWRNLNIGTWPSSQFSFKRRSGPGSGASLPES